MGFYMLAGTVQSDQTLQQIQALLEQHSICSEYDEDEQELTLLLDSTIIFRAGFAHEFIVVGDAIEEQKLLDAVKSLSQSLSALSIQHAFELYDMQNQLIHELEHH